MTISNRITFLYGGIFTVAILVINAMVFGNLYIAYRGLSRDEMAETVDAVCEHIKSGGALTEDAIAEVIPYKYIETAVIIIPPGDIYERRAGADIFRFGGPFPREAPGEPPDRPAVRFTYDERVFEYGGQRYLIRTYWGFERESKILRVFYSFFILFNCIGIAVSFIVGRYISGKVLKPISDITKLASQISVDDLSRRIETDGPDDEINLLAKTFNDMIGRLAVSFEKQSRFVSDASHELRTPVSVIQGYANLLARWGKEDPEILTESIESIQSETQRMGTLIKKLLYIAGDLDSKQSVRDYICLNDIVRDIVKEAGVMDSRHDIKLLEDDRLSVYADGEQIKQMLWIFIENSIKYCKNGKAEITVRLYCDDVRNCVIIKDEGIGIREKDLPHIFERFYRGDKSRSKTVGGTGLGLSIAQRIIKGHNAEVSVKSSLGHGTEVLLSFEK